jgi:hypothetical protein
MVVRCLFLQCLIVSVTEFPWRQIYSLSIRTRADQASGMERAAEMRCSWNCSSGGAKQPTGPHIGDTNFPGFMGFKELCPGTT